MAGHADSWQGGNSANATTQTGQGNGEPAAGVNEQHLNVRRLWREKYSDGLFVFQRTSISLSDLWRAMGPSATPKHSRRGL